MYLKDFFTKLRIWWFVALLVQIGCGLLIYSPHFSYSDNGASYSYPVTSFYEGVGLGQIYSYMMMGYFLLVSPLLFGGFSKRLKIWPLAVALTASVLFALLNALWLVLVILSGTMITESFSLTLWFYLYVLAQLGQIIELIFLIVALKKSK